MRIAIMPYWCLIYAFKLFRSLSETTLNTDDTTRLLQVLLHGDDAAGTRAAAAAFGASLGTDDLLERDHESVFAADLWRRCAEAGVLGTTVPERLGGSDGDLVDLLLTFEGLGYGCADLALVFALSSQAAVTQHALLTFGTPEQQERYVPALCRGARIGCTSITEEHGGSDPFDLRTTARRDGDHYVLDGHKVYVTLAPVADVAVVLAATDPAAGRWGVTAFLVDRDTPGVTFGENRHKMGLRTVPFGDLTFDGCRLPAGQRLGREGAGLAVFNSTLDSERNVVFVGHVGALQRQLEESIAFARHRRVGGRPIGAHQSVSNRIVDMRLRIDHARYAIYRAAMVSGAGGVRATLESATAKLVASEAAAANALDRLRIHGAQGYVSAYGIERELRDSVGGLVYSGTNEIQRNVIARLLGLEG